MTHIHDFNGFKSINESSKFKAPKIDGTITTLKKSARGRSKKKDVLYAQVSLNYEGKSILPKDPMGVGLRYNQNSGMYESTIKVKNEEYQGKLLIKVEWNIGKQEVVYGMRGNVQWVEFKERTSKISSPSPSPLPTPIELPATGMFEHNSSVLSPKGISIISEITEKNKANGFNKAKVDGYASMEGKPENNLKLSQNRADAVAEVLKGKDVKVIHSKGHGGTEKFGKGEENYEKNRKVMITFGK